MEWCCHFQKKFVFVKINLSPVGNKLGFIRFEASEAN